MAPNSSSTSFPSILIAQTLGLTSAAFLSGHILLLAAPHHAPSSSSSSLPSNPNPRKSSTTSSSLPTTTNALVSLVSLSSFAFLSSKYFMTLNQRKSELYALAALTIGVVGLGPEVWTWAQRYGRAAVEGGDERPEKEIDGQKGVEEGVHGRVEGEERKERTWNLVRGLLVFGAGLGAGGWAVWG